jgi:dephospho-CoA kinase
VVGNLREVAAALARDPDWAGDAKDLTRATSGRGVHLAVFVPPFLEHVLEGRKTVESRFSIVRCAPYKNVSRGDLVLLKQSGGPVVGVCEVGAAWFYEMTPESWTTIRREFATALCADSQEFWQARERAAFATLMYVTRVKRLPPVVWEKKDRRGWVVVRARTETRTEQMMRSTVVAFSGSIASGKSTLSEALARSVGCKRVSFGEFLRKEAKRRGLEMTREALQELGADYVDRDPEALCRNVLSQEGLFLPGTAVVVDGVRHASVVSILKRLVAPAELRLVHVASAEDVRYQRLLVRGEDAGRLREYDKHSTESEVETALRGIADLVVDGTKPTEVLVDDLVAWAAKLK